MIRAASLVYAIGIALVLAITSSSLILLAFNTRTAIDNSLINEKLIGNVVSGLNYYLTNSSAWESSSKSSIDLFQHNNDSVDIEKKPWGLFEIIICKAHQGNKKAQGIFLAGDKSTKDSTALYLADNGKPLALAGTTLIKGNAYIPALGVRRAFIEGQNFIGNNLIDGNIYNSALILPVMSKNAYKSITLFSSPDKDDSIMSINALPENKTLINSFNNRTIVLTATEDIYLDNYNLQGNIILQTIHKVEVGRSSSLSEILIQAGSVTVDQAFKGSLQIFAHDAINIGEEAMLLYPSSVCMVSDKNYSTNSKITLQAGSSVKGNIVNFNQADGQAKSANIEISENCNITGLVYSNGCVTHKGTITGSLYCTGFVLKTSSALYQNHLLNAVINSVELPGYYVGSFPLTTFKRKALIKRLE